MKLISRFGLLAATMLILATTTSAEAGWRKRIVVLQPTTVVTAAPVQTTQWVTSNGGVIESKYSMIGSELGTSAPPLPVVGGYVTTSQRVKVVTPRRVVRYYPY